MTSSRTRASRLLTGAEATLYDATRRERLDDPTLVQLRTMLRSARRSQNRYRKLALQQDGASRRAAGTAGLATARGRRSDSNAESTRRKAAIFSDMVTRIEIELARRQVSNPGPDAARGPRSPRKGGATGTTAASQAPARKRTGTTKKSPTKKSPTKKAPTKKSPTKKAPTKKAPTKKAPTKKAPTKKSRAERRGRKAAKKRAVRKKLARRAEALQRAGKAPSQALGKRKQQVATDLMRRGRVAARGRRQQARRDAR